MHVKLAKALDFYEAKCVKMQNNLMGLQMPTYGCEGELVTQQQSMVGFNTYVLQIKRKPSGGSTSYLHTIYISIMAFGPSGNDYILTKRV